MLVHLGCEQNADRGQLNEVGCPPALGGQHREVAVSDTHGQVESVLGVTLDSVELLDEGHHRLAVLRADT